MRASRLSILVLCLAVPAAPAAGDDLLSLADRAGEDLTNQVAGVVVRGVFDRLTPSAIASRLAAVPEVPVGSELHWLGTDGRAWYSTVPERGQGPAARDALWAVAAAQPVGVASDLALNETWTELVRRDVAWKAVEAFGYAGVVVVEQGRMLDSDPENPWSGKWIGAYSGKGWAVAGDDVREVKDASSLSAILLQSGSSCWVRITAGNRVFQSQGIVHHDTLRAGAAQPIRILELRYTSSDDRLRGRLESVSATEAVSSEIFLQRLSP